VYSHNREYRGMLDYLSSRLFGLNHLLAKEGLWVFCSLETNGQWRLIQIQSELLLASLVWWVNLPSVQVLSSGGNIFCSRGQRNSK
jgi:hypothetical protein